MTGIAVTFIVAYFGKVVVRFGVLHQFDLVCGTRLVDDGWQTDALEDGME